MSKQNISVSEADIDDDLIRQHAGNSKSLTIKLPSLPRPRFKKPSFKASKVSFAVIAVLIIAFAAIGGLGYKKYMALREENRRLANPQAASQDEANRLKNEVAQLIELPNENPTIATVVDVDKLKSQPFFANAQNGDRVLLFANAKKAILYRPATKKIVEVAPINIGDSTASSGSGAGTTAGATTTKPNTTTTTPTTTTTKKP